LLACLGRREKLYGANASLPYETATKQPDGQISPKSVQPFTQKYSA